jgi:hypothetical protein
VTGVSSTIDVVEERGRPLAEPLGGLRPDEAGGPHGPTYAGVGAAARLQVGERDAEVGGVVGRAGHPAGQRAARGARGDRRVPADDGVPGRGEGRDHRVDRRPGRPVGTGAGHRGAGGDGDAQRPAGCLQQGRLLPREHRVRHREVGHGGRQRPVDRHARPVVGADATGDHAPAGLEGDQPAGGGGQAQRAQAVVAVRQGDRPGGDRRRAAARAAGRRARGVPGLRLTVPGPSVAA